MNIYLEKVKVGMFILPHITKSNPRNKQQTNMTAETIPVGNKIKRNYKMEF